MERSDFQNLLLRYRQGLCSEEEVRKIHRWFSELNEQSELDISPEERDAIRSRIEKGISLHIDRDIPDSRQPPAGKRLLFRWWYVAAFLLIGSVSVYYLLPTEIASPGTGVALTEVPGEESDVPENLVIRRNTGKNLVRIALEDGSKITLLPNSELSYVKDFLAEKREVYLKGNAFFDIVPDSTRPFLVYHSKLVTQVLGTSFWIKTNSRSKTQEVEVVTGTVRLYEQKPEAPGVANRKKEIILKPNQKGTYFEERGNLAQSSTLKTSFPTDSLPVAEEQQEIAFRNATLEVIKSTLEDLFKTDIVLSDTGLSNCTFTGDVSNLPLTEIIGLISRSIGKIEFETIGNQIVVYGEGCK